MQIKSLPIEQYIKNLPLLNKKHIKYLVMNEFKISAPRFYYYAKIYEKKKSFKELVSELDHEGCHIYFDSSEGSDSDDIDPEVAITVTPAMK